MDKEMIQAIKDRKEIKPQYLSIAKMLELNGMSNYESVCCRRILEYADDRHIMLDIFNCDVLIDDSLFNVTKAIQSGLPALLIDRPHNQNVECEFRIYNLDYEEILDAYINELNVLGWQN